MRIKLKDIKADDLLVADGSSPCLQPGTVVEVFQNRESGNLAVGCKIGTHYLREDEHGDAVGFQKYVEPTPKREDF